MVSDEIIQILQIQSIGLDVVIGMTRAIISKGIRPDQLVKGPKDDQNFCF